MVEKTFVILRRWGQRGKGDLSRFSAAELEMMRLGVGSGGGVDLEVWAPQSAYLVP